MTQKAVAQDIRRAALQPSGPVATRVAAMGVVPPPFTSAPLSVSFML
jgi:hypothetical protein